MLWAVCGISCSYGHATTTQWCKEAEVDRSPPNLSILASWPRGWVKTQSKPHVLDRSEQMRSERGTHQWTDQCGRDDDASGGEHQDKDFNHRARPIRHAIAASQSGGKGGRCRHNNVPAVPAPFFRRQHSQVHEVNSK